LEYWLLVIARPADDLQDFACRSLARQFCLQLAELADVLDGDDGLHGEGLDKGDVSIVEWIDGTMDEDDGPETCPIAYKRCRQLGAQSFNIDQLNKVRLTTAILILVRTVMRVEASRIADGP